MNAEIDREGYDELETEAESAAETAIDTEIDANADTDALDEGERVDARHLLYDMVSTPSVSGDEETAVEVLKAFFEAHDREVWIDETGNVRVPTDDVTLLASHVDTVPGDVPMKVEDGVFWGHGSADAIGPFCTMAATAAETGVSLVGVVGEEISSRGVWHLVEDREESDAVVDGEPSGWDGVMLGYRGFFPGTYISMSELGHSSRPEENAIQSVVVRWSRVADLLDEDRDGVPDAVTTKPMTFDGDPTEDGLMVEAMMDVQFHVPPRLSIDDVHEIVKNELTRGGAHWGKPIPPVMMSPRADVARAFRVVICNIGGVKSRLLHKTGISDMGTFAGTQGCPTAIYGFGDSGLDHAPNEHLDLAEFDSAIDVLADVCERLADD